MIYEALAAHPEGITGVLDSLKDIGAATGVGVRRWAGTDGDTPEQIEQGLGSTGLIEKTRSAERRRLSSVVTNRQADTPPHAPHPKSFISCCDTL